MAAFCAGCGAKLALGATGCRECKTPALGAKFHETITVPAGQDVHVPPVCCCCLRQRETVQQHNVLAEQRGKTRYYVTVQVPWCRACLNRRLKFYVSAGAAALAGVMLVVAIVGAFGGGGALVIIGALLGGGGGFVAALKLLPRYLKSLKEPGHVAFCDAFQSASPVGLKLAGRRAVQVGFANRAFAHKWRELNGAPAT